MSKFAERFMEKGRKEGFELGLQQAKQEAIRQGMRQGEQAVLLRQLESKYGAEAAAAYRERIEQADSAMLTQWAYRVLTAETIEQVFH